MGCLRKIWSWIGFSCRAMPLIDLELPLPGYALLETRGRKTRKPRRTPVGDGRVGNQFWLVAEHGKRAGYVRNIEHDPHVRQRWLANQLPSSAGNARAVSLFGTQLLTVRIDLDG